MSFNGNLMRATAVEQNLIADLEARLQAAELAREEADLAAEQIRVQAALLAAHNEELSRQVSMLQAELRLTRAVAGELLAARQLEVAAVRDLLHHVTSTVLSHDHMTRQAVSNVYAAMSATDKASPAPTLKVAV